MASNIKITFLGTSAQIPTAKKNHTGILLNWEKENILIDCGEGIQRQFRKAKLNPCKINRILITHKHGDHVFGLPGLISTLIHSDYNKTLYIYGPKRIKKFLEIFLSMDYIKPTFEIKIEEVCGKFLETEDFYIEAEKMEHGIPCNAYSFINKGQRRINKEKLKKFKITEGPYLKDLKEGKDILYKGKKYSAKNLTYKEEDKKISFVLDTLYNERIASFVKNSDLFICEATYCRNKKEMAKEHKHLTAEQAGKIAKKGKVKKLILTHLSGRYDLKEKDILDESKKYFKNTYIAKDFDDFEI